MQRRDPFFVLSIYMTYILPNAAERFIYNYMVTVALPGDGRIRSNTKIIHQKTIWTTEVFTQKEATQLVAALSRSAAYEI